MKILSLALFALTTFSALAAGNPAMFVGRYQVQHTANCDRDPGTRAYVSIYKDITGQSLLTVNYYSSEAVYLEIPLMDTKKVTQNAQQNFTEITRVKWLNSNTLGAQSVTQGTSYGQKINYSIETSISRSGNKVVIVEGEDGREKERCEMTKY